jgi:hypothetical protein
MKFEDFLASVDSKNFISNKSPKLTKTASSDNINSEFLQSYKQACLVLSEDRKRHLEKLALQAALKNYIS